MAVRPFSPDAFPPIVAPRGASSTHPENTLPSFEAAIALGASVVELDARLTADGVAVVMHDPEGSRTTDGAGLVHELTAEQVRALRAGTYEVPAYVPTLAETLEALSGRTAIAIEIKNIPSEPAYEPDHESIVRAALGDPEGTGVEGAALVLSFNPPPIAGEDFVAEAHAAGIRVGTWTVDDAATVRMLLGWGVDAIASNDPSMAVAEL